MQVIVMDATRIRDSRAMRLGRVHSLFLWTPVAVVAAFALFTFSVMWINPAASMNERGDEGLLYSSLVASIVELVAVPAALVRLWRSPALRGTWSTIAVLAGILPIVACALLWLALLLGLG
jgi:hypothetical protein